MALAFAFLLAWLGNLAGLAPIVGAYAAGLILEPAHVQFLEAREEHELEALVHPLVVTFAPIFFVLMGAKVDVTALLEPRTLLLAALLALLGILGKYVAGYAAAEPAQRRHRLGHGAPGRSGPDLCRPPAGHLLITAPPAEWPCASQHHRRPAPHHHRRPRGPGLGAAAAMTARTIAPAAQVDAWGGGMWVIFLAAPPTLLEFPNNTPAPTLVP
ncbi:MAG: cation:proton antiporter [Holophaga sp.]|nr:cation:proton antiporter [Holophaga sp.]